VKTIAEILREIRPEFDFDCSQDLVGDGILDSFDMITLVADIEKTYNISIPGVDIVPENFRNIAAIQQLIERFAAKS
jgi:acyl carrier protein